MDTLTTLWVIRHSVAHNAGFVTAFDAARINQPHLGQKVADIDGAFISATFGFLAGIAGRLANNCGSSVMCQWMKSQAHFGPDWVRDERTYRALAQLKACVRSRSQSLPEPTEAEYLQDWAARVA